MSERGRVIFLGLTVQVTEVQSLIHWHQVLIEGICGDWTADLPETYEETLPLTRQARRYRDWPR
jgi:hypothetical protein